MPLAKTADHSGLMMFGNRRANCPVCLVCRSVVGAGGNFFSLPLKASLPTPNPSGVAAPKSFSGVHSVKSLNRGAYYQPGKKFLLGGF
jgi:hypothetical protein